MTPAGVRARARARVPTRPRAVFDDEQGRVHACIAVDFVREHACYLSVPPGAD